MRKQHRTGRSIVRLAAEPWTPGATGRQVLHLELTIDGGAAEWLRDGRTQELDNIAKQILLAVEEAYEQDA